MADFQVRGAEQVARAARALKAQGEAGKGLRRELFRTIQRETKPIRQNMQRSALVNLPRRGGLNQDVAASRFSTRTRTGANTAGVRIVVTGKQVRDVRSIDRGRLRHPVFGNWEVWVNQPIPPGVFDKPFQAAAPAVRRELTKALGDVVKRIERNSR